MRLMHLRKDIACHKEFAESWHTIRLTIHQRGFLAGQPLYLVQEAGNQMLDGNSYDEAYNWLDLMVVNVERADGKTDPY